MSALRVPPVYAAKLAPEDSGAVRTAHVKAISRRKRSKETHELGCLKLAQKPPAGFPEGTTRPGDAHLDCYVAVPNAVDVAFELTEQVDQVAVRAPALARNKFSRRHPEHLTGWRRSLSPGDIVESIAAEPDTTGAWAERSNRLIDRFVTVVAEEVAERHSFEPRVSGEPIWTIDTCGRVHPQELTRMDFHRGWKYSFSRDRIKPTCSEMHRTSPERHVSVRSAATEPPWDS